MSDLIYVCKTYEGKAEIKNYAELECVRDDGELYLYRTVEIYTVADDEEGSFVLLATWKVHRGTLTIVNSTYDISEFLDLYSLLYSDNIGYNVKMYIQYNDESKYNKNKTGSGYNHGGMHIFNDDVTFDSISGAFGAFRNGKRNMHESEVEIVLFDNTPCAENVIAHFDSKRNILTFNSCYIKDFKELYKEYKEVF